MAGTSIERTLAAAALTLVVIAHVIVVVVECFNLELDDVVVHNPSYLKDSRFGYSVAAYKPLDRDRDRDRDDEAWILVGAPHSQRERTHAHKNAHSVKSREGAVYRCKTSSPNSCYMLPFDKRGESLLLLLLLVSYAIFILFSLQSGTSRATFTVRT